MADIQIKRLSGPEIEPYINTLAQLRIEIFKDYPYLYLGTPEYEHTYLKTYSDSPESLFVLAFDGPQVVGVSTGVPMEHETPEFKRPFEQHGYDPAQIFYFGESVLQKEYRGKGIGVSFFEERERYARSLQRFTHTTFCAVERPIDHPRRPEDYVSLDQFWANRGYKKQPQLATHFSWQDWDASEETQKLMVFWLKTLSNT